MDCSMIRYSEALDVVFPMKKWNLTHKIGRAALVIIAAHDSRVRIIPTFFKKKTHSLTPHSTTNLDKPSTFPKSNHHGRNFIIHSIRGINCNQCLVISCRMDNEGKFFVSLALLEVFDLFRSSMTIGLQELWQLQLEIRKCSDWMLSTMIMTAIIIITASVLVVLTVMLMLLVMRVMIKVA